MRLALAIALALATVGCGGDEPAAVPAQFDDDLPRDLTRLAGCQLPVDRMPPHVPAAFLSAEDRQYYKRTLPDPLAMWRPLEPVLSSSSSRIVHQVVNLMPAIIERCTGRKAGPDPTDKHRRKTVQGILAARLELELTRPQLLSIFLGHVYLGHGAYGVVDAARIYFGKELALLTIAEAALLAGLVASPTKYAPHRNLQLARERQRHVLSTMREDHQISDADYQTALAEPISLAAETP